MEYIDFTRYFLSNGNSGGTAGSPEFIRCCKCFAGGRVQGSPSYFSNWLNSINWGVVLINGGQKVTCNKCRIKLSNC